MRRAGARKRGRGGASPLGLGLGVALFLLSAWPAAARAASPWVYRGIVVPRGQVALDLGAGIGHMPDPSGETGVGLNLEIAGGVAPGMELGLRAGIRPDDAGRATQADLYARPFDTETYGTDAARLANPELHLRWAVARGRAGELGLELAAYLPIEGGSSFGMMFALPVALHARRLRVDTGIYVPVIFSDPTRTIVSIPIQFWIQASPTFFLGPVLGIRFIEQAGADGQQFPFGFGLGSVIAADVDLRAWFLFPDVSGDRATHTFGVGLGFELRFG
jgi:hypothetical protein